jgi:hypothetical protein
LCGREGRQVRIRTILSRQESLPVYNLSVLGLPYYVVGPTGILVHNTETEYERLMGQSERALEEAENLTKAGRTEEAAQALRRAEQLEAEANAAATQRPTPPATRPTAEPEAAEAPAQGRVSANQMNAEIRRGQAPPTVERVDTGKILGEQTHVHLDDGSALNMDGTWKHGGRELSNAEIDWLTSHGWPNLP